MVDDYVQQEITRLFDRNLLIALATKVLVYADIYYIEFEDKYYEVLVRHGKKELYISEVIPKLVEITEWEYV